MALDKTFQRFAFALQTKTDFERSVGSYRDRPFYYQYKAVTHLSELKPILDQVYESLRREEQERRQRNRLDEAVAKKRDKLVERLAKERENRRLVVYSVIFTAVLLAGGFVVDAINKHFYGVPIDIALTASGAGILAFVGAFYIFGVWLRSF